MKKVIELVIIVVLSLFLGAAMHKCQNPQLSQPPEDRSILVIDTIPYFDTIPYYMPTPTNQAALGVKVVYLPIFQRGNNDVENIPQKCNITAENIPPDSVAVEIPIMQLEYEGENYHAWVSGYDPKLDSIFVFNRHDVVTIRDPPDCKKRWGVGLFAGYGITPFGFQPCIGVSINYNIWTF